MRILWFILTNGFGLIWFLPHLFFSASLILLLVVQGVLADTARIDEEFRKACFPTFAALVKGIPALRNSIGSLMVGYQFCLRFI